MAEQNQHESDAELPGSSTGKAPTTRIPPHRLHLWQVQAIRDVLVIMGGVFVVLIGYWLRSVTVPLLIALALAYLFEPLVSMVCEKRKWSRPKVVGGLIGVLALVVLVVVVAVVPLLFVQTIQFVQSIRPNLTRIAATAESLDPRMRDPIERALGFEFQTVREMLENTKPPSAPPTDATNDSDGNGQDGARSSRDSESGTDEQDQPENGVESKATDAADKTGDEATGDHDATDEAKSNGGDDLSGQKIEAWLKQNLSSILQFTVKTTGDAVSVIGRIVGSTIYVAFLLFLIPFYFYFFSISWPKIKRFVRDTLPPENFREGYKLVDKMDHAISGFVRGRIVISAIMGVLLAIGWGICGVPYWLIVGLSTGVLCAVPYLGGIGIPVAIVLLWLGQGDVPPDERMAWWGIILWPSLVFGIVQLIEGYGLTPYIAGKATNLGPVSILVAVLAGGVVAGVYGMLLAIPVMACLKILITEVLLPRIHLWARGQAEDILPIDEN